MRAERRKDPRLKYPLQATWHAASHSGSSRIGDISLGGCFVESLTTPQVGEQTLLTVVLDDLSVTLPGTTRSLEPRIGFSVEFDALPPDVRGDLERLMVAVFKRLG